MTNLSQAPTPLVVGVGASAGGFEAFVELLTALGPAPSLAIIFVQHLDPSQPSLLPSLLAKKTEMPVVEVLGRTKIKPNTIYVSPPHGLLELNDGEVRLVEPADRLKQLLSIDHLFHTIAEVQAERGIGVVLSGSGSDGTLGLKAISDRGGLTIAQDEKTAQFDSMPRSAATTGVADHVLSPSEIATELLRYVSHLHGLAEQMTPQRRQLEIEQAIPAIAERLQEITNHNFQHYKPNTLIRRIQRRMQVLKIETVRDYLIYLQQNDNEVTTLFRELLIGVTAFFRDPDAFSALKHTVLSKLFSQPASGESLRMWVAGCANGAEAYTLAMLCCEVRDELYATSPGTPMCIPEMQIFATDIDERALSIAREGAYPAGIEDQLTPERLKRFFIKRGKQYHVTKELRELVLFSQHNLISDPPFSRQDLICCRNLLIYLGAHLQNKLIPLFHYALRPNGYLFLGPSENIVSHGELFRPIDSRHRISQRKGTALGTTPTLSASAVPLTATVGNGLSRLADRTTDLTAIGQRIVLDEFAPAYAIIDDTGQVLNASARIDRYLRIGSGDYHNNIVRMAAEGLRIGLRAAIADAKRVLRKVQHENMSISVGDKIQRIMLTVQPMPNLGENEQLLMVVFHDVGLPIDLNQVDESSAPTHNANSMLAQMERELEATRNDLDRVMQDMEAANEELKSANEELLSMNEELQSANEELETSKEEIRAGSDAVARSNADLQNLLRSTQIATVFLDDQFHIRSFTPAITDIYSLLGTDIGRPLQGFVPHVQHMPPLPNSQDLRGGQAVEHTIVAKSGKSYIRRVLPYQLPHGQADGIVVTFIDVTALYESEERYRVTFENAAVGISHVAVSGHWLQANQRFCEIVGYSREELLNKTFAEITHPDDLASDFALKEQLLAGEIPNYTMDKRYLRADGGIAWARLTVSLMRDASDAPVHFISVIEDIADRKHHELERSAAETALRDNEYQLRMGMEVARFGVAKILYHSGRIELSAEAAKLLGLGQEQIELALSELQSAFHADDHAQLQSALEPSACSAPTDLLARELRVIWPDGSLHWLDLRKQDFCDHTQHPPRPTHAILAAREITDQKWAEERFRESEERFREMANTAPAMIWVTDENHQCTFLSHSWFDFTGQSADQGLGLGWIDAIHPDDRKTTADIFHTAADRGEAFELDYRLKTATGNYRWVVDSGKPRFDSCGKFVGFVGSVVDIHDRRQTEELVKTNESRMRLAAEAAGFGTLHVDLVNGYVTYSQEFKRLLGLTGEGNEPLQTYALTRSIHPEDRSACDRFYQTLIQSQAEGSQRIDLRIVRPDGQIRWMRLQAKALSGSHGHLEQPTQLIGTVIDITQQRQFEASLNEARELAEAANASKSEFLANMSHEIRTPMTAILGYTDLLRDYVTDEEAKHHLGTIRRNGDYLLEIINDILDLSKIEAGKLEVDHETFDPSRLMDDVRRIMEVRALENKLSLAVEYAGPLPEQIVSDAKRLKQILINLVGNAIKFTRRGGVKVTVEYIPSSHSASATSTSAASTSAPSHTSAPHSAQLRFKIIDSGIGMSPQQQQKLFKPFVQGDSSVSRHFGGTGLGLAISRRLATMLGGDIRVESQLDQGSTFELNICVGEIAGVSLVTPQFASTVSEPITLLQSIRLSCRVLVVDDRRDIRFLSHSMLTKAGATVEECEDGRLAVEFIRQRLGQPNLPDLVLLDMQMPNLDGYQTAEQLRGLGYTAPIIALTADAMQGDMGRCLECGCNDYLSKPIDAKRMLELVARLTNHRPSL
jgi:two-component system CheB/CheR fusion protein